jgi:long-chain acyl-CoA synthetase
MSEQNITLHAALLDAAERCGGSNEALRDSSKSLTLEALVDQSRRLASALAGRGISVGDRVLIWSSNRVDFVIAHFAVLFAGAISVPVDQTAGVNGVKFILESSSPKALILPVSLLPVFQQHSLAKPGIVIVFDDGLPAPHGSCMLDELISDGRPFEVMSGVEHSSILYTTGASGRPKGVLLNHTATIHTVRNVMEYVRYTSADREVIAIPITHSFGLGHVYCNLFAGGAAYLENGLSNVKRVLTAIDNWGATGFPGTPLGFGLLLDNFRAPFQRCARNLRFVVINSAPLAPERAAQLQEALPSTELFVYYGLTEASRSTYISLSAAGPSKYAAVGRPMKGVDIEITGDKGEILIRGPHLASGYWCDEELSSKSFGPEGLRTGDLGRFDNDGFLYVTGRISDLINFGGFKIDPVEVEQWLRFQPEIADAAVAPLSVKSGEEVVIVAIVVLKPGVTLDGPALERRARGVLDAFKVPSKWIESPALPRSSTGKMLRGELPRLIEAHYIGSDA